MTELVGQYEAWKALDQRLWAEIQEKGPRVYKPDELQHHDLNISLVIKIPDGINAEISRKLQEAIPDQIHPKIQFQPWQWYHMTIQWSLEKEIAPEKKPELLSQIRKLVSQHPSIKGSFHFPYVGNGGPWGVFFNDEDGILAQLKEQSTAIWTDLGIKPFVPPMYYETAYVSLSRFIAAPSQDELVTIKNLPIQRIENIILDQVLVVRNDKIMTPEKIEILLEENFVA